MGSRSSRRYWWRASRWAEAPDVAQILKFQPTQQGVVYDIPGEESLSRQVQGRDLKGKQRGYVVRDHRGLVIRQFMDTNGDGKVDRWSYYMNGQEVYRDIDSNLNGRPDEFRFYHAGGSRWGSIRTKMARWTSGRRSLRKRRRRRLSPPSPSAGDFGRMEALMLTPADLEQLGVSADVAGVWRPLRKSRMPPSVNW